MATFKHISSKNADYGAAEQYLTFEHDEFTMRPTLDETGRLVPREDYRLATLNCGGEDFAVACMRSNLRYGKNQKREDVKSHHYIISFDPRDGTDNGLTVDRAQELGERFCKAHFPGHQAIVCTHPDGHNHSGNIHVHIVINSLRIEKVPLLPYMDRPADTKAGCKHRCTDAAMEYFKAEVMEMCHWENLYQIDLLHGSKNRVTEREYWAQRKGQAKLDRQAAAQAAALPAGEQPPKPTKFETDKEKLRQTIRAALSSATSYDEFSALLLRQGVTVKESRGRLSYLTPERTKPITARKLGDGFDRTAVLALLEQNAHRAAEKAAAIPEYTRTIRERLQQGKTAKTAPKQGAIQRMVDREAKRAEGKGVGYDRWAAVHNLKQMAATVAAYEQYGFTSPEQLDAAITAAYADLHDSTAELKTLEAALQDKKELQGYVLRYAKTKDVRDGLKAQKSDKARAAYRQKHESDFIIADAAARYFREHGIKKLPTYKSLQAEIEQLTADKNARYNDYREKKERVRELQTVKGNIDQMLIVQDQVWNRVTVNRAEKKATRYYMDEFHLLLKEEQTAAYSVEIWKRFRKWGGIPTAITQNVKDLLSSREVENIFENSDFVLMLNQAQGDRAILAKQLNISPQQMKYVTHTEAGEGLIFYGNVVLPFIDRFPTDTELYRLLTTKPEEVSKP